MSRADIDPSIPPVVSAIVTTRNSRRTLEQLLRSLRAQTYAAVEVVVVDNSSTDGTPALAESYADRVAQWGPERSAQRNRGVALSSGRYVLILDSDMRLAPGAVEACVITAVGTGAAAVVVPERTVGRNLLARCRALERRCYEGDATIEAARFFEREAFLRHGG